MTNSAEFPTVCLCWGDQDLVSIVQANTLNSTFSGSGVPYFYNVIPGVGHTMNFPTLPAEILECISFIDASVSNGVVDGLGKESGWKIYPNPAQDFCEVA